MTWKAANTLVVAAFVIAAVAVAHTGDVARAAVTPADRSLTVMPRTIDVRELGRGTPMTSARAPAGEGALKVGVRLEGLTNDDNEDGTVSPPDPIGAMGPHHFVEFVNNEARVWTRAGVELKTFPLNAFFATGDATGGLDPRIIYDVLSHRWIGAYAQGLADGGQVALAVSRTANPLLKWSVYALPSPSFPDFPGLGVSSDKIGVSAYAYPFDGPSYAGGEFWVVGKADALAGKPLHVKQFFRKAYYRLRPVPAQSPGETLFVLGQREGAAVDLLRVSGVPGEDPVATRVRRFQTKRFDAPPFAPQKGTTALVHTGYGGVLDATWQDGRLWASAANACTPAGDSEIRACLHLIEIDTATNRLRQDFYRGRMGAYYFYPALRETQQGDLAVVFGASSSTAYASIQYSAQLRDDRRNTLRPPALLRKGEGFDQSERYGDYFGAGMDPVKGDRVWVVGEYMGSGNGSDWRTYVAEVVVQR